MFRSNEFRTRYNNCGLFDRDLTKKLFNIPAKYQPELLLPIGYIDRKPTILHERRKALEELVKYNNY